MNKIKSAEKETADTKQVIETFENIVNSNISQKVLNGALTYCDKCGETRLESALRHIVGLQDDICFKCEFFLINIFFYDIIKTNTYKELKKWQTKKF